MPYKNHLFLLLLITCGTTHAQVITTIAGNNTPGFSGDNGQATAAMLSGPRFAKMDASGNLYIADFTNNRVRKVTPAGIITTVAGNGTTIHSGDNGPATAAGISAPQSIALDKSGNLYIVESVSDGRGKWIREVNLSGVITTIAGGALGYGGDGYPAIAAGFENIADIAIDHNSNIYITDFGNSRIRKIGKYTVITTIAGNGSWGNTGDGGPATDAQLNQPMGLALDAIGNVYFADQTNNSVRKIDTSGFISTIAGKGATGATGDNGPATNAELSSPTGMAVDGSGNVYISDFGNSRVRMVKDGIISTIAGNGTWGYNGDGSPATAAQLSAPMGVYVDAAKNIYIGDIGNNVIRKIATNSTGVANLSHTPEVGNLQIWPQPNNGAFSIITASLSSEPVQIIITNIAGQIIKEIAAITNTETDIQIGGMPGMYFVTAIVKEGRESGVVWVR
jgi:sugar lactone lactonase YvrE